MKKYYVYAFLDESKPGDFNYSDLTFDYEPFYIGKGNGDRIITSLLDRESPFKVNKIKKIKRNGGKIIKIKLLENLENDEALEFETQIIKKIGRRDLKLGPLVNQTDGGDGRLTSPHSEETKRKISETKKAQKILAYSVNPMTDEQREHLRKINQGENNPFFGKHHTDEIKEEQSLRVSGTNHPMWGKKHDDDTIQKIREKRNSVVNKDRMIQLSREINSKSVIQYTLEGEVIQEFYSIKEASKFTGCSESIIGKCCRGVIKKPRNFMFKFKDAQSLELKNSYAIKIGDNFEIDGVIYKLIKRNKSSAIAEKQGQLFTFRKKEFQILFEKIKLESEL
jgi:group I intron endonuclease